jgi:hypothetical protein
MTETIADRMTSAVGSIDATAEWQQIPMLGQGEEHVLGPQVIVTEPPRRADG